MKSTIFLLAVLWPAYASGSCSEHWLTDVSDPAVLAFCEIVDKANSSGDVAIMKKPKCPRNGPSSMPAQGISKCNPTSITLPDFAENAIIWLDKDGSYGSRVFSQLSNSGHDTQSRELAIQHFNDHTLVGSGQLFVEPSASMPNGVSVDWQFADPDALTADPSLLELVNSIVPWAPEAIEKGSSVVFVVQE